MTGLIIFTGVECDGITDVFTVTLCPVFIEDKCYKYIKKTAKNLFNVVTIVV